MQLYCVLHKDVEQGDDFVNGPFQDKTVACAWAAAMADDYKNTALRDEGLVLDLDASEDGTFIQLSDPNDDPMREFFVLDLISPLP